MIKQINIANNNIESKHLKKQKRLGKTGESVNGQIKSRNKFRQNRNNTINTVHRESSTKHVEFRKVDTPPQKIIIPSNDLA